MNIDGQRIFENSELARPPEAGIFDSAFRIPQLGCPLAPYLFITFLKVLSIELKSSPDCSLSVLRYKEGTSNSDYLKMFTMVIQIIVFNSFPTCFDILHCKW